MNDQMKIEAMKSEDYVKGNYFRLNVLEQLLINIDSKTQNLHSTLHIPDREIDTSFMWKVLGEKLGYDVVSCDDGYNYYHECFCFTIQIKRE